MPYPFQLPTTGSVLLSDYLTSSSHPSLPLTATTKRSVLKDALKKHKRLSAKDQAAHLPAVQDAVKAYIPYLLALSSASGYRDVGSERVDVDIVKPLEVEWRTTVSATLPGREPPRPKCVGLHHEIAFTLNSLAYTHALLARSQLRMLHGSTVLSPDQRTAAIGAAMKHLLEAHSIHTYLLSLPSVSAAKDSPPDTQPSTISALASLALAEATLTVVSKDDPYAAAVSDDRNENNTDWMFKAPTIPKVRSRLFAGICLAAAEHASTASGLLSSSGRIDEDLTKYATDLRRTARGKAARFLAISSELSGSTGEALAYIAGARRELGLSPQALSDSTARKGLRGLKHSWQEKREDRKLASSKGTADWGLDAGRLEEARVVEMLEAKWDRENSTVNVQVVPDSEPLMRQLPSAREYHSVQLWNPPVLDSGALAAMRAPPEPVDGAFRGEEEDSGGEDRYARGAEPVGAFPGTGGEYGRSAAASNNYY
jgi:hypothetical protein